jgi:glycosyltransferase involved in cell wall biosynthesis
MTRVLFIPDFGDSNEYQNLLRESVESDRFDTVGGTLHHLFPLVRNVRRERIDIVHLIWMHPFFLIQNLSSFGLVNTVGTYFRAGLFLLDLLLVRLYGAEIVWTVHNKHNHERRHVRLDHTVSRVTARLASEMTVECSAAKETIVDLFWIDDPEKIHVIEEGSYIDSYPNTVSPDEARERLDIASETQLFVYFGQIREYKGVDQLIDAFTKADLSDAKLLVVGKPFDQQIRTELGAAMENVASVEPVFEFVPNEEIQLYMNAADVVALPYRDILTSGSVLLAMSFGRPVVTPNLGCIPALVGNEGNFIYEANDRGSLQESLEAANSTPDEELEAIGTRNYEMAAELTWDRVGSTTRSVYEAALDGQS